MASAFEAFMQTELPLRPFTPTDGNAESIAIRRGQGPRQMTFLDLQDGQVLARVNGVLQGVTVNNIGTDSGSAGGVRHYTADVAKGNEQSTWTLNHGLNSKNFVYQIYQLNDDNTLNSIIPDSVLISDANTVVLKFAMAMAGKAVLSFVD
jgi:hypothetical protein